MTTMATSEAAASKEPGGPQGPVDATWLILQRLEDLRRAQEDLGDDLKALDARLEVRLGSLESRSGMVETKLGVLDSRAESLDAKMVSLDAKVVSLDTKVISLDTKIDSVRTQLGGDISSIRNWSLGLLLLAILGMLAKLLIPGA